MHCLDADLVSAPLLLLPAAALPCPVGACLTRLGAAVCRSNAVAEPLLLLLVCALPPGHLRACECE